MALRIATSLRMCSVSQLTTPYQPFCYIKMRYKTNTILFESLQPSDSNTAALTLRASFCLNP